MPPSVHTAALIALAERQYQHTQNDVKGDKACSRMTSEKSKEGASVRGDGRNTERREFQGKK